MAAQTGAQALVPLIGRLASRFPKLPRADIEPAVAEGHGKLRPGVATSPSGLHRNRLKMVTSAQTLNSGVVPKVPLNTHAA